MDAALARRLASALGLPELVARVLVARGLGDPEAAAAFLSPDLGSLHDPFRLKDMDRAVARLRRALEAGERITVYGDYDVDGVTSTASLVRFLGAVGADVDAYIPRRLEEGYGLNLDAVERLAGQGTRLLVTCDCGVTAVEEVDRAVALGVDVVVIDHHRVPATLPRAAAILNPYQAGCDFPFQHLAAVGVVFNLLLALRRTLRDAGWFTDRGLSEPNLKQFLDLVALGTVADVVPLQDENRVLVAHGLQLLAEGRRPGIRALKAVAGVEAGQVTAGQVGFRLGPRINAAGRLDDARAGLRLLLAETEAEAMPLAEALDRANTERREIERRILGEAAALAETRDPALRGLVLAGEGWHRGVVGIVASRIVERFHRPALVLALEDGKARGSGRSYAGFHLHDALVACEGHLTRYGGHRAAAGLELPAGELGAFQAEFEAICADRLDPEDLVPILRADAEVDPADLTWELCAAVERLAPFGMGHPAPVLVVRGAQLEGGHLVGRRDDGPGHLKARLGEVEAIGFDLGGELDTIARGPVDLAFTLGFNWWRGRARVQATIKALAPAGAVDIAEVARATGADDAVGHVHE